MNRYATPVRSWISMNRSSTRAWVDRSSADTGSSQTISFGSSASARAIAMRCRCPPENSRGSRSAGVGRQPDLVEQVAHPASSPRRRHSAAVSGSARICSIVIAGLSDEYGSWKTTWMSRAQRAPLLAVQVADVLAVVADRPAGDRREAEHRAAQRRLARPGLADEPHGLAGQDVERDALEGPERLRAEALARVLDDQVVDLQQWRRSCACSLGRAPRGERAAARGPRRGSRRAATACTGAAGRRRSRARRRSRRYGRPASPRRGRRGRRRRRSCG